MKKLICIVLVLALLFGCSGKPEPQEQRNETPAAEIRENVTVQNQTEVEETVFKNFTEGDFSLEYPDWPAGGYSNSSILAIQHGPCMLNIDRHNAIIDPLFNWIINNSASNENVTLKEVDIDNYSFSFNATYENISFNAKFLMKYCNYETYIIGATTAENYCADVEDEMERFLSTAECAKVYEPPDYSSSYQMPGLQDTEYNKFKEQDFSVDMPDWNETNVDEDNGVLGFARGPCFVGLNKYNTPAENLFDWIENYIEENGSMHLVHKNVPEHDITYELPYENFTIRSRSRAVYCNYHSYNVIAMCESSYYANNSEILDHIVESASCAREYTFAPEIKEVKTPEPEEERIVETDIGEEYGINAEAVVYFFNGNPLFVKIMKPYDRVNLRVTDDKIKDIKLKAILEQGIIVNVKEGSYSDADFTIMIPLDDALNIFNNADKITLANALSFVANVETDPPEMKNKLIANAFKP